jgi:ribA/ribD-fused uncharacterized protein
MAQLMNFFTSNPKRTRNSSSDPDQTPASKKQQQRSTPEITELSTPEDSVMMADMENTAGNTGINTPNQQNIDWFDKLFIKVSDISKQQKIDSTKLNNISLCSSLLEAKLDEALIEVAASKKKIDLLTKQVDSITEENTTLRSKLSDAETYSKKNNLKFFGIPELKGESTSDLMDKLAIVLSSIDIDLSNLYIDNLHRLPSNAKGPRPLIVKFTSFLDRQLVWNNRHMLATSHLNVSVREHFPPEVESNIRTLLPIRRAALQQKLKVKLIADKLYINNQLYTTKTLHCLPANLRPESLAVREIGNHLFFYSSHTFLSNFSQSRFNVDDIKYSCSEQFIQHQKALLFDAKDTANKILLATAPGHMKRLTSNLPNYKSELWEKEAPKVCHIAIKEKFIQNPDLLAMLQDTKEKILVEASPYDRVWGIGFGKDEPDLLQKKETWGKNILGNTLMAIRSELGQ